MPRTSSKQTAATARRTSSTNKQAKQPAKSKIISHTDDGTPIVNATLAQIRKGLSGKASGQLVRIPQVAERSKLYAEAAEVIGERESLALPYHGGRTWKCEVKVSDADGACGHNKNDAAAADGDEEPKKRTNYHALTPLFRWYRGSLVLATLPYILEDIVEVEAKMPGKKRWANGMSDDELDSSDEEWDDERYRVEPSTKMTMEISALTASAREDSSHPMPHVGRSWISPDLQRFQSRKSAMAHAEMLVKRDLLIDRTLYGYGHNGVRLRPAKPTRKQALEAGMARFLRDGLWIVGQEELWIEKRRDVLVKKQEKRLLLKAEKSDEGPASSAAVVGQKSEGDEHKDANSDEKKPSSIDEVNTHENKVPSEEKKKDCDLMAIVKATARAAAGYVHPVLDAPHNVPKPSPSTADDDSTMLVTPVESDASTIDASTKAPETSSSEELAPQKAIVQRSPGIRPPPAFAPSTHYCLNEDQIIQCFSACVDHYEKVMMTVKARSLHHELADGFDVLRERGRGRYDMELPLFDTEAFSFLTDMKKAAWMPIVHKILGEDALLVHKGCFLSLPGSETQVYHQDGVHLNKKTHKPCYAINVFIPLVDYDMTNGPTEFCLGTHYLGYENFVKESVYTPCVTAGTPVIFDYRLGHRGLRNFSSGVRPVVYLTYSSVASGKEFRDSVNFSKKCFRKLGEFVEKPLSREERAKRRRLEK